MCIRDSIDTYLVPTLIIHNFVENAITHAVSLDNHVAVSYTHLDVYKRQPYRQHHERRF